LELSDVAYRQLEEFYRQRGRKLTDFVRDQSMVIEGSVTIPNTRGTAAGMIIPCGERFGEHWLVLMPGVPTEMEAMMTLTVIPFFTSLSGIFIIHTPVKTSGIGETILAEMIVDVEDTLPAGTTLAYLPHTTGVNLTVSTVGNDRRRVEADNRRVVEAIVERAGKFIYATVETSLEETICTLLLEKGLSVAAAESCTGGLVSSRLTDVPGSSGYFLQGVVTYSNKAKEELLGVRRETLQHYGAVSEEVAREMALGCLLRSGADLAVATTGIAGPSGATPHKPVGMLCIGLAKKVSGGEPAVSTRTMQMYGDRLQNKLRFSEAALFELLGSLR
jgi:nicotinamide-nucleotide amidase